MPAVKHSQDYFSIIHEYNSAPAWQKDLMLRGSLLSASREHTSQWVRQKLTAFVQQENLKRSNRTGELQTQG